MQATSLSRSPARTCIRQLRKDGSHAPLSRGKTPKPSRVSKFGLLARGANRENAAAQETKEPKTTVQVDLGARSYPIYIGPGLLANGDMLCKHIPAHALITAVNNNPRVASRTERRKKESHMLWRLPLPRPARSIAQVFVFHGDLPAPPTETSTRTTHRRVLLNSVCDLKTP